MKRLLNWIGLILLATAVGLALVFAFTAAIRVQSPAAVVQRAPAQPSFFPPDSSGPSSNQYGYGGGGAMGPGMMGGGFRSGTWDYPNSGTPLTLEQAVEAARQYVVGYGNPDLALTEVMEFSDNFYAQVEEKSANVHAFELLIDRYTGAVYPEPGPNMMWNSQYGHMRGMMGGWGDWQTGPISVTAEQALVFAQEWLDQYLPGMSTADQADAFYGYYTIHVLKDGQVYGMVSVNGYTGEVWYHTWHGNFIGMRELEE